jgi:hypothetical protein
MGTAALVGAAIALLGAMVALAFLPARPQAELVEERAETTQP